MDNDIIIAIIGGLLNIVLSLTIPCMLKNNKEPILLNIKKIYEANKNALLTSTLIVIITIYVACKISDNIDLSDYNYNGLDDNKMIILRMNNGANNLKNFANLNRY
jgi:hypothetical protein